MKTMARRIVPKSSITRESNDRVNTYIYIFHARRVHACIGGSVRKRDKTALLLTHMHSRDQKLTHRRGFNPLHVVTEPQNSLLTGSTSANETQPCNTEKQWRDLTVCKGSW